MTEFWERLRHRDVIDIDYPGTRYRAHARNFLEPSRPREIRYIVIHITGGPAMDERSTLNTFHNGPASAHYLVSRRGDVTQFVRDAHIANHIDNINSRSNRESIGIEHVNPWNRAAHETPTDAQYRASAQLVAWLCDTYGIPRDHNPTRHAPGIRGHIEEQPNSGHLACPNAAWDWGRYMGMVRGVHVGSFDDTIRTLARGAGGAR
jgi:N-acetylmuramoyl-L-alanine amidase